LKPFQYIFAILFTLGVLAPSFSFAKTSAGHKKAAKYLKALPEKGGRSPASAGKHKVKSKKSKSKSKSHASYNKKSNRKPASKKKAKKAKSHHKKSKHK